MKKILIYFTLFCGVSFVSCNEWLDVKPRQQNAEEDQFSDAKGFQDALISCYIKMNNRDIYGEQMTMRAVEWLAQHWSYAINNTQEERSVKSYDYESSYCKSIFKSIYAALYNVISQANSILENLEKNGDAIPEQAKRAVLEAEALGIRAFIHMDVLRLFGQVPHNPTITVSLPYAETVSYKERIPYYDYNGFCNKILSDLDRAETLLSVNDPLVQADDQGEYRPFSVEDKKDDFYSYRRFRINYYSILAMKARLYMYMGRTTEANKYAKDVISYVEGRGQMELAGNADFLKGNYGLPSECILALSNSELPNYSARDIFKADDGLFQLENEVRSGIFGTSDMAVNNRGLFLWNMDAITIGGAKRPLIRKYLQPTGTNIKESLVELSTEKEVIPLLRLSEMYLIAMETSSLSAANELYVKYMYARNVTSPTLFASEDAMMNEILNEYRREFFAEGQMFYAYKRRGTEYMLWQAERIYEENYVVPLPDTEYKGN